MAGNLLAQARRVLALAVVEICAGRGCAALAARYGGGGRGAGGGRGDTFAAPADPRAHVPDEDELTAAARIAAASPRTTAYLALTADKSLLFNESRTAFLMYAVEGSSWVSLGDPVGAPSRGE